MSNITDEQLLKIAQDQFLSIWGLIFKLKPTNTDLQKLRQLMVPFAGTLDEVGKQLLLPCDDGGDPPIIDPPIIDPPTVEKPSSVYWLTDATSIPGIKMLGSSIGLPGNWWPGATQPWKIPTETYKGIFRGYTNDGKVDPQTGHYGTLWAVRIYDAYGLIEDIEVWDCGDFVRRMEGHVLYMNCVPHLDTTIRNLKVRKNGAQAVQREWRTHETSLPVEMWGAGGGTFLIDGADLQETGLIDEGTGGQSVRASWALSLYNTMQRTIVRKVKHVNYWSPAPHEGSVWIGPGQSNFHTPYALIEDCDFWTATHDRAEIFLAKCTEATVQRTFLRGEGNYIAVANDCGKVVIRDMPQDTVVNIQGTYHAPAIKTYTVLKGTTLELNF